MSRSAKSRLRRIKTLGLGAIGLALLSLSSAQAGAGEDVPTFDIVVLNGRIVDGTGNPWYRGDIGIKGKTIAAIGDLADATASRTIDARNLVVAPGFIDMHSHAGWSYLVDPRALSKLSQGVTLEVEGEGYSVAPLGAAQAKVLEPRLSRFGVTDRWRSLESFFDLLERKPATINFATHIGSGTVRQIVIGDSDRPATPDELQQMCGIVDAAMREGALGLFSALRYPPDLFNRTDELIAMARVAGRYGGIYQTHPRSEADDIDRSLDEMFKIAGEASIPTHLTHLKLAYQHNWGRMAALLKRLEDARSSGLDVTADIYPYEWAGGTFTDLLPPWAQDGGRAAILSRLRDKQVRDRIKRELVSPATRWENEYRGAGGGPAGLRFIDAGANAVLRRFEGLTLAEIAEQQAKDPRDAMLDIIEGGDGSVISLIASGKDIQTAIIKPWVAFGTDGPTVAPDGPLSATAVHPRAYGSFPKIFARYVRELGLLSLEEAVRRASSLPAQRLDLRDRGLLRPGYFADIVIFDPTTIADSATYERPHQLSRGIDRVIVNGAVVFENGHATGARPGMVVRGPGYGRTLPSTSCAVPEGGLQ